ncbi:HECT-domain (ubiquitin-transferase) [compost metagenome]
MFNGGSDEALWNPNDTTPYKRNCITFRFYQAENENRLPAAHVCFYCIDMPKYNSFETMKKKLIQAMEGTQDGNFTLA